MLLSVCIVTIQYSFVWKNGHLLSNPFSVSSLALMSLAAEPINAVAAENEASESLPLLPRIRFIEGTFFLAIMLLRTVSEIPHTGLTETRKLQISGILACVSFYKHSLYSLFEGLSNLGFRLMFHLHDDSLCKLTFVNQDLEHKSRSIVVLLHSLSSVSSVHLKTMATSTMTKAFVTAPKAPTTQSRVHTQRRLNLTEVCLLS